jgi:dTDP-4-dehydrorhamnose 3,5-epimerase
VSFRRLETELDDLILIEPTLHGDARGYLVETYRKNELAELGIEVDFVQDNQTRSRGRVLRGIHMQRGQAKLVRCPHGRIWDVAVDVRPDSPTYGRWEGFELDGDNHRQLFVPAGFGHGFCLLSDEADVLYRLSAYFDPELETGIAWDDPELGIEWPITDPILSERDTNAPHLAEIAPSLAG